MLTSRWFRLLLGIVCACPLVCGGTQEIYVWQRQFTPEVSAALRTFQPQIDGCCMLAAEVSWSEGRMQVVRPMPDYSALIALKRPVGLAIRVGGFAGPFASDDSTGRALRELAADVIAKARAAGLAAAEVQVDFDCAESKLAGYRSWLIGMRAAVKPVKLVFTALPVWLRHAEFAELARAADGFVLQVHSLERPASPDVPFVLCDPRRAREWALQADAVGVPFRVALPTYGYLLGFDTAGKFLAMAAEGRQPSWPAGTRTRIVRTHSQSMMSLVQDLASAPLSHCTGVIWFRLPVASDLYNWDAVTFACVLRGEVPVTRLAVNATWVEPGLVEIEIANTGQTTEVLPPFVTLRWPQGERAIAADGIGGFRLEMRGDSAQGIVRAADVPADASIAPGRRMKIAWLRFAHEISLDAFLPAPP